MNASTWCMEDHGGHHLQPPAAALAYAWEYLPGATFEDHGGGGGGADQLGCCAFSTASELRRALVRALAELESARAAHQAELRRMESEAARLAALVASAAAERDELRRQCHSLLLLLNHQAQAPTPPPSLHAGVLLGGGGAATAVLDEHAPDAVACADNTELEMALARRLPEKGRLVEAVVSAGPLLQTLLLAGPLPRWRHPPPPAPAGGADIPPFNPGRLSPLTADASNSSSSASAGSSSPESNCSGGGPLLPVALPSFHMSPFCL
ncbi:uncharacterized protein LOC133889132 [Phragmites australis]|uniref:uncharacterized protein LOC133889132 n=1 Tax=Phragmites australis TaxID=29695 RepID=UPI002D788E39|nr:uncharacterized protein LOC133889132 [Phragmites australis]